MGGITLAELRHGLRRFVAPAIAIVLGVAFVAATLTLSSTMKRGTETAASEQVSGYSAVVSGLGQGGGELDAKQLTAARGLPGVDRVTPERVTSVAIRAGKNDQTFLASTVAPGLVGHVSGRTTAGSGEVLLNSEAASSLGVRPGSTVTIGGSPGSVERRTVAGVVRLHGMSGMPYIVGTSDQISTWSGQRAYDAFLVAGGAQTTTAKALRQRLGDAVTVRTATAETDHRAQEMVTGITFITMFFGMFALIALFVAGMVIANTFQILLAQRARQLALLRCVGASRRQVTRAVVGESLVLGVASSAIGVATGVGLVFAFTKVSHTNDLLQLPMDEVGINPAGLLGALAVGTVVTVASAVLPARRASRVAPLAALRPELASTGSTRTSRVRLALGFIIAAAGFVSLLVGASSGKAPIAVPGGILASLGIILTAPVTVPAVARRMGWLAAKTAGVPGELATDNTARNPRRTAATSTALLVGITLMAAMLVGAATSKKAIQAEIDEQFALDVQVTSSEAIPKAVRDQIAQTDGVAGISVLRSSEAAVKGPRLSAKQDVVGVPPSARSVMRDPSRLDGLRDGTVLLGTMTAQDFGIKDGDQVPIGKRTLTAKLTDGDLEGVIVTTADLVQIAPNAQPATMWLRLTSDADPGTVVGKVRNAVSTVGADVSGAAGTRSELDSIVRLMLTIVTALLGIAVLIALVGVANTLGLSVLERQRETALLRALGFTAGQVRQTLAIEALLVALVAAVVGSLLGVLFGWAGARSLLGTYADGVLPQVPWGTLAALIIAAAGCALLASWAPARRAARTSPVSALAAE
ncbi:ABC transporter permease [Demetria terragena]|uniref:ABC transporter permease n=1 Tax=Demetria terragena TaxID=63959 RepID=UPI0003A623FB|nr:FtsX-like permease family protein [Demetria terragena]